MRQSDSQESPSWEEALLPLWFCPQAKEPPQTFWGWFLPCYIQVGKELSEDLKVKLKNVLHSRYGWTAGSLAGKETRRGDEREEGQSNKGEKKIRGNGETVNLTKNLQNLKSGRIKILKHKITVPLMANTICFHCMKYFLNYIANNGISKLSLLGHGFLLIFHSLLQPTFLFSKAEFLW